MSRACLKMTDHRFLLYIEGGVSRPSIPVAPGPVAAARRRVVLVLGTVVGTLGRSSGPFSDTGVPRRVTVFYFRKT